MRTSSICLLFVLSALYSHAQYPHDLKYDHTWVMGYGSSADHVFGKSILSFNGTDFDISYHSSDVWYYATCTAISDTAGHAVFLARNMFALVSDTIDYNDDMLCWEQYGFYRTEEPYSDEGNIVFELYPNPAVDAVQLTWNTPVTGNWNVTVMDITGTA